MILRKGTPIEKIGEGKEKIGFGIAEYGVDKTKELASQQKARSVIHYNHMVIKG